ncbi:TVP38/TMEM64 family protein [Paenibacillus sp. HJGM_3]|uniref:TVP38/TMEM64 family protein n=1 Tax=Paenibacillus sp. HJGM_3 TaxID=3379816 RepID=UPI00385F543C
MDSLFDLANTAEWLRNFGMWAVLVSLLLNILISVLGVVPSVFLSGANAVVFGLVPGFFVSLAGEILGAGVSFILYRFGLRKALSSETSWKWLQRLNEENRAKQLVIILLARLTPLMPSGLVTVVAALSTMRFVDFMLASLVGKAPSIALETLIGHDLIELKSNYPRLLVSFAFVIVVLLLLRSKKTKASRRQPE